MTPEQFKTIRVSLGLSQSKLAPLIGNLNPHRVSDFETVYKAIPWHIGQLMHCYERMGLFEVMRMNKSTGHLKGNTK